MLMPGRRSAAACRVGRRLVVALATGVVALTLIPASASAVVRPVLGLGSVSCSISATIRFRPALTMSGGGTRSTGLKTQLSNCTTYGDYGTYDVTEQVSRGWFRGNFSRSPFSCETLAQTSASISGSTRWADGYSRGERAKFDNSGILDDAVENGSFGGTARVVLGFPSSLASQCASGHRVTSASVTGTLTLGPPCGPGSGALTIYQIAPGLMCGGNYLPDSITAGPDGALWFTNQNSIGRITTSGAVTLYPLPGAYPRPNHITAGPDGALWFTDQATKVSETSITGGSVGRITTSGAVTIYPLASGSPGAITAGSDGALWFFNSLALGPSSVVIDRITTSGTITSFTSPLIYGPAGLTAGPDGALWFANALNNSIGRVTTSGTFTTFTSPLITGPIDIAAGPDGALWFTNENSIGRITTSGTVTRYFDSSITNPWSIGAGPDGAVWFTNYAGSPAIGRVTTAGIVTAPYDDPNIAIPFDITTGPDGGLWFTNYGSDTIGRITPP
jgi:virginiamycin B lyase